MCGFGRKWEWSGRARDDYVSEISDRKWALKKRPVIAHIKARSKHSFKTETAWHKKKKKPIKLVGVSQGLCAVCVCVNASFLPSGWAWHCGPVLHLLGPCR